MAINFLQQMRLKRIIKNLANQNKLKITDPLKNANNNLDNIPNLSEAEKSVSNDILAYRWNVTWPRSQKISTLLTKTNSKTITKDEIESIKTIQKSINPPSTYLHKNSGATPRNTAAYFAKENILH